MESSGKTDAFNYRFTQFANEARDFKVRVAAAHVCVCYTSHTHTTARYHFSNKTQLPYYANLKGTEANLHINDQFKSDFLFPSSVV